MTFSNSAQVAHSTTPDMSFFLVFLLSSLAFINSATAEDCTLEQLNTLASNSHVAPCSKALGFSEILSLAALSKDQVETFCTTSACMELYHDVLTMGLGDCTIPAAGAQVQRDIVDPVTKACGGSVSSSSSSSGFTVAEAGASGSSSSSVCSTTSVSIVIVYLIVATLSVMLL